MDKDKKKSMIFSVLVGLSLVLLVAAVIISVMMSCTRVTDMFRSYPQDNVIEEIAEDVIDHYTGVDVDLTPWSPEKH